jgi:hypothetical protein
MRDEIPQPNVKCIRPLVHRPQFEGKINCKRCAIEQNEA